MSLSVQSRLLVPVDPPVPADLTVPVVRFHHGLRPVQAVLVFLKVREQTNTFCLRLVTKLILAKNQDYRYYSMVSYPVVLVVPAAQSVRTVPMVPVDLLGPVHLCHHSDQTGHSVLAVPLVRVHLCFPAAPVLLSDLEIPGRREVLARLVNEQTNITHSSYHFQNTLILCDHGYELIIHLNTLKEYICERCARIRLVST